jgi:4'-phosphopantetheinyl transferase
LICLFYARPADVTDPRSIALCDAILTGEERARRDRFLFERHRQEFLVTRALARTVLAAYAGLAREDLRFAIDAFGKPSLDPAPDGLSFNLSNALTLVVCAVTDAATIGVDVEPFARADRILGVASNVFTPAEREELASLDPIARKRRAVELWTSKEAYMKARGLGMSLPPSSFAMRGLVLASDPPPRDEPDRSRWTFMAFDVEDHCVTICVEARAAGRSAVVPEHVDVRRSLQLAAAIAEP